MLRRFVNKLTSQKKLFALVFGFYLALWYFNPSNKIIAFSYLPLFFLIAKLTNNWRSGLWHTWLASTIIVTGKQYTIEVLPSYLFSNSLFPDGIKSLVTITPSTIITIILCLVVFRDRFKRRNIINLNPLDILITIFYILPLVTDFMWSKNPELSLIYSGFNVLFLGVYWFIKNFPGKIKLNYTKTTIAALILFECFVAIIQLSNKSPAYKNLESQVGIELFGQVADEKWLPFRVIGTFPHANNFGLWLSFFLMYSLVIKQKPPSKKFIFLIVISCILIATLSRSSWVGVLLGSLFSTWFIVKKYKEEVIGKVPLRYWQLSGLMILPIFILYFLPRIERSTYSLSEGGASFRLQQIEESIDLIKSNFWAGVGTKQNLIVLHTAEPEGIFGEVPQLTHNWFLQKSSENGVPSVVIWLIIITLISRKYLISFKNELKKTSLSYLKIGFLSNILCLIAIGFFQPFMGSDMIFLSYILIENQEKENVQ